MKVAPSKYIRRGRDEISHLAGGAAVVVLPLGVVHLAGVLSRRLATRLGRGALGALRLRSCALVVAVGFSGHANHFLPEASIRTLATAR